MSKTSVIIPVYILNKKRLEEVERCLGSLALIFGGEVIIVDDASPIPFYDATIRHGINMGYTRSVNDGIREAKGDTLIISNDDVEFIEGSIEKLEELLKDPTIGVASLPTSDEAIIIDGRRQEDRKFGSFWGTRKDVIKTVGYLDEELPHYFSDTDYFNRMKRAGYRVVKDTSLVIPHKGGSSYSIIDPARDLYFEGSQLYKEKHGKVE